MAVQLFKRTKQLELKVDEILDLVSQSAMTFDQAIDSYLSEGIGTSFNRRPAVRCLNITIDMNGFRRGRDQAEWSDPSTMIPICEPCGMAGRPPPPVKRRFGASDAWQPEVI